MAGGVVAKAETRLSVREEVDGACRHRVALHAAGTAWRHMLVVAPGKRKWRDRIGVALDAASVPGRRLLGDPGAKPDPSDDVVHVTSVYGAEGLAFPAVVVMGLGDLPWKQQPLDEALRIDRGKARMLQLYLAAVPWGEGTCGAAAAAMHYFNVPPAKLSGAQAVWLAAMLHAPDGEAAQWASAARIDLPRATWVAKGLQRIRADARMRVLDELATMAPGQSHPGSSRAPATATERSACRPPPAAGS